MPTKRLTATEQEGPSMRALLFSVLLSLAMVSTTFADGLKCDMTQYKESAGLTASLAQDVLDVTWAGQNGSEVRARYAIDNGQPVVRELSIKKKGGQWAALGQNL